MLVLSKYLPLTYRMADSTELSSQYGALIVFSDDYELSNGCEKYIALRQTLELDRKVLGTKTSNINTQRYC